MYFSNDLSPLNKESLFQNMTISNNNGEAISNTNTKDCLE
ncbi:hypothetical protein FEM08_13780 [Flavobacterium gilvum]|nr:hypothetical protein FEM08_13780 [Flavobacterium gilvum]